MVSQHSFIATNINEKSSSPPSRMLTCCMYHTSKYVTVIISARIPTPHSPFPSPPPPVLPPPFSRPREVLLAHFPPFFIASHYYSGSPTQPTTFWLTKQKNPYARKKTALDCGDNGMAWWLSGFQLPRPTDTKKMRPSTRMSFVPYP